MFQSRPAGRWKVVQARDRDFAQWTAQVPALAEVEGPATRPFSSHSAQALRAIAPSGGSTEEQDKQRGART
ncbi:hypothetical protein BD626DRAFT_476898 [Schizophyllum amplum]|uniref:Uncharacterized protein n=1 Tax=Schizophyllum amplum TaxID=97359 RepID=A0A550CZS6_9AGAR|nr:hypothetical protein BD626DRAFT_476898 [Auriculariopsis ampla]